VRITVKALPIPGYDKVSYDKVVSVQRELITTDKPLAPNLIYLTRTALWPLYILWLICPVFLRYHLWPKTLELSRKLLLLWQR